MAETNSIIDTSDISLLYPDADSLRRHSLGEELAKLNSPDYQKQVAEGIYQAILRAFDEGY